MLGYQSFKRYAIAGSIGIFLFLLSITNVAFRWPLKDLFLPQKTLIATLEPAEKIYQVLATEDLSKLVLVTQGKEGQTTISINGVPHRLLALNDWVQLGPRGEVVYVGKVDSNTVALMVDGKQIFYDYVRLYESLDSKNWGFIFYKNGEFSVVINNKLIRSYKNVIEVNNLKFVSGGNYYAYRVADKGGAWIVYNGKEGKRYPQVCELQLSENGKKFAYFVQAKKELEPTKGERFVIFNNREGRHYKGASWLTFTEGDTLRYQANDGEKEFFVIDDKEISFDDHSFSSDGRLIRVHLEKNCLEKGAAFTEFATIPYCKSQTVQVAVNGKKGDHFQKIWFISHSQDGKTVGYLAFENQRLWWIVVPT